MNALIRLFPYIAATLLSASAFAQTGEATLIIKYPFSNYTVGATGAANVRINDGTPYLIEQDYGANKTTQIIQKVHPGVVKIESSHWKLDDANYINQFDVKAGKTYTVVVFMMAYQMWDVMYSASQDMLGKNLAPQKSEYSNYTIKNQLISIKNNESTP